MKIVTDSQGFVIARMTTDEAAGICDALGGMSASEITVAANDLYLGLAALEQAMPDMACQS